MEVQDLPGRAAAVQAAAEGAAAAKAGETATNCPYSEIGDFAERYRRRFWLRGFQDAGGTLPEQQDGGAGGTG
ncbi:Rmf/CrpP family protein [Kitasatospora sp. NPDC094016]|uniref:Rmf/CrpP family protein n=1 Tax=Kitasatospora sp. NPDC094016 TaxID=3154986 RepID=UPI0033316EFD